MVGIVSLSLLALNNVENVSINPLVLAGVVLFASVVMFVCVLLCIVRLSMVSGVGGVSDGQTTGAGAGQLQLHDGCILPNIK